MPRRLMDSRLAVMLLVFALASLALVRSSASSGSLAQSAPTPFPGVSSAGQIAFSAYRNDNYEICMINADGSEPRNLTNNSANDCYSVWSPGGSQIAFATDRDGDYEIYVMNADGSEPRRLTNNTVEDHLPAWQPVPGGVAATTIPSSPPGETPFPAFPPGR